MNVYLCLEGFDKVLSISKAGGGSQAALHIIDIMSGFSWKKDSGEGMQTDLAFSAATHFCLSVLK